jgi:hypothetical protein
MTDEQATDKATQTQGEPAPDEVTMIGDYLSDNPDRNSVTQIADGTGLDEDQIRRILDEWRPTVQGYDHIGPGGGGPWVTPPENPPKVLLHMPENGNGSGDATLEETQPSEGSVDGEEG